jgi:acyl carrier protein
MTDERARKLATFIRTNLLQIDDAPLDLDTSLVDNGSLDSMGSTLLAAFIEEQFGVKLDDESISPSHLGSIRRILALLDERRGQAGGPSVLAAPREEVS